MEKINTRGKNQRAVHKGSKHLCGRLTAEKPETISYFVLYVLKQNLQQRCHFSHWLCKLHVILQLRFRYLVWLERRLSVRVLDGNLPLSDPSGVITKYNSEPTGGKRSSNEWKPRNRPSKNSVKYRNKVIWAELSVSFVKFVHSVSQISTQQKKKKKTKSRMYFKKSVTRFPKCIC